MGKSMDGIKINEPAPNVPASTPPSGPQWEIPIQCFKRYAHHDYISFSTVFYS
jgi:hypothetical protein